MKTTVDLENIKSQSGQPFGSAYECLFELVEDYYISKLDGKKRIRKELNNWDKDAHLYIFNSLYTKNFTGSIMIAKLITHF